MKDKAKAEGGGIILLIFGCLILLASVILAFKPNYDEFWLIGISLGVISIALGSIAVGMSAKSDRYVKMMLKWIDGTIQQNSSAELDLARYPQSGIYKLIDKGREKIIYDSSRYKDHCFLFGNAWIRLDSMKESDVIRIRMYITEDGIESLATSDEDNTYHGVQLKMAKLSGGFYNKEGVKITAELLSDSEIEIGFYAYDAMRGN